MTEYEYNRSDSHSSGGPMTGFHFDDFRRTLIKEWHELQDYFLTEERKKRLMHMTRLQKLLRIPFWLLKALFQKLNWFRRLLLIASFIFIFQQFRITSDSQNVFVDFDSHYIGFFILLFILMLELKDKLLARNELEAGRAVQKALRPEQSPIVPGWSIWLYTRTANEVGGDLLDYIAIDEKRKGIALGDVSDKGLAAALLMAKLQATLRAIIPDKDQLPEVGAKLNQIFHQDGLAKNFASLIYLEISPNYPYVKWINAGHMPPIMLRQRQIKELSKGEAALGLSPNTQYTEQSLELEIGDSVLFYSDGLSEARNEQGAFFGEERIQHILLDSVLLQPHRIGASLLHHIDRFIGDAPVYDDLTLAIIQRVG